MKSFGSAICTFFLFSGALSLLAVLAMKSRKEDREGLLFGDYLNDD